MNQVDNCTSTADQQVIAEFVGRMQDEYERLERDESHSGLIQSSADPANYQNTQIVAAWDGQSALPESEFFRVRYREMSADRFVFWMTEAPTAPYFVLIVESSAQKLKLKARVIDVKTDSLNGEELFVVETEFEGSY